ncbi:hypothetical protein ETU08_01735 [Apibacter muscae]|uniref:Uncharacterized protein n=1 Tax=Apibacter muscae TaxID=2509004 RepID=A0A563DJX6_9FLAO|nr:hypothetical protein [Apibacter muscae]TWP23535.1 hypothetical protein ETU10_07365 [Apibacter muscae]TWP30505.1 hypothetical protein ETU09_00460 [Apibacter muscae]TWP31226.1 hypothetical protein ETU08_01735 [Apibacter muscae]
MLDKAGLIEDLKALMNLNNEGKSNTEEAVQKLADAIEKYVKSGKVQGICPPNGGALQNGKVV